MIDPHVVALHYSFEAADGFSVIDKSAVFIELPEFRGVLEADGFVATMLHHYPTELSARAPVDRCLCSWKIAASLVRKETAFKFNFVRAEIVDRAPPAHRPGTFSASSMASLTSTAYGSAHTAMAAYPRFPTDFLADTLVETLWFRYDLYKTGRDLLFSMAYFCLTQIGAGSRRHRQTVANRYNIDVDVLNKLGDLSSDRGSPYDARKFTDKLIPPTSEERAWLEAVIPAIIAQVGQVNAGGNAQLRIADLPRI